MVERHLPKPRDLAPLMQFKKPQLSAKKRRLEKRPDDRRPARDRQAAYAQGRLRLHRGSGRGRDLAGPGPAGVRGHRVPPLDPARRLAGRHLARGARRPGRAAVRHRPDRLHPDDADRGRARRRGRGRAQPASRSRCRRWAPARSRTCKAANPTGRNWFQLYMWKDRDRSMALVDRAAKAGFDTLLVTVDVPVAGARLRDKRNGMSIPPALTPATVVNAIPRPAWWINFLTTEPLAFASLDRWSGTVAELLDTMFDPTVDFDDLAWIKEQWPGKVVVKGVQNLGDAQAAGRPRGRRHRRVQPRWPPARPGARSPSTCCPRWSARSATTWRSTWTPASCPGPTSSPRWPWAPGSR